MSDSLWPHGLQHARPPCPSPTPSLPKLSSIELVMPSNHLILCCCLLPPSIFPSIRVFPKESVLCTRCLKYWSFSFSISPSNEYSGLVSFRINWFDLLALQGSLKSLLQHHSSKVSILQHSAFFTVRLSHSYMTAGKTIALTRHTFVGKVMPLLLNMLSRLVVEVMEFQMNYSKSWKMMLWKCCTQYASKFGKLSSGHRTGKGQFSFQSQRKAIPKNAQTTAQLHSSHTLVK